MRLLKCLENGGHFVWDDGLWSDHYPDPNFKGALVDCPPQLRSPWMFPPPTFSSNIGLIMLPSDFFRLSLAFLVGYSAWELQALQLIVLVVFGAVA